MNNLRNLWWIRSKPVHNSQLSGTGCDSRVINQFSSSCILKVRYYAEKRKTLKRLIEVQIVQYNILQTFYFLAPADFLQVLVSFFAFRCPLAGWEVLSFLCYSIPLDSNILFSGNNSYSIPRKSWFYDISIFCSCRNVCSTIALCKPIISYCVSNPTQ